MKQNESVKTPETINGAAKGNEMVVASKAETAVQRHDNGNGNSMMTVVDLENDAFPEMDSAIVAPIDLMADYWTPEKAGESKRLLFDGIRPRMVKDQQSDAMMELDCAFFYEKVDGKIKSVSNGSKRLVGVMQNNNMQRGSLIQITYLGKIKNKSNQNMSDNWEIKPLIIKVR